MPIVRLVTAVLVTALLTLAGASSPAIAQNVPTSVTVTKTVPTLTASTPLQDAFEALRRAFNPTADEELLKARERLLGCMAQQVSEASPEQHSGADVRGTLGDIADRCAAAFGVTLPDVSTDGGGLVEIGRTGGLTPGFTCKTGRGDPRLAEHEGGESLWNLAGEAFKEARKMRGQAEALEGAAERAKAAGNTNAAVLLEVKALFKRLQADEIEAEGEKLLETAHAAEDFKRKQGTTGDAGTKRPAPGQVSPCEAAADLARKIGECAARGWRGGECELLAAQLYRCSDPRITDPAPDAPTCAERKAAEHEDDKALLEAYVGLCEARVRYGPDGGSPCEITDMAMAYDVHKAHPQQCQTQDGGTGICVKVNVCTDERALIQDPDACFGTVTVLSITPTLTEVIEVARDRLGGPTWTPPGGAGPVGPGGPEVGRGP